MPKTLPSYLHTFRKRSGLTQRELGFLLRISFGMVSKLEKRQRQPSASVVLAVQIIFGVTAADIFPELHEQTELKVMKQGAALFARLEGNRSDKAAEKRQFLLDMIKRVPPPNA